MTFGKHFKSLYEGSMIGAGAIVFAVWGYVIANADPHREWGMVVRLNPKLLGPILGENPKDVERAIEYLCSPDPESNSKECDGCRMIRHGQFEFQVVNGARYMSIRNEEDRKRQLREAQARFRGKQKGLVIGDGTEIDFLATPTKARIAAGKKRVADRKARAEAREDKVIAQWNAEHPGRAEREAARDKELAEIKARMNAGELPPNFPAPEVTDEARLDQGGVL